MSNPNVTKEERKKERKEKRELKKKERAIKRASRDNSVGKKIWNVVRIFFKGVWKAIKGFCKYILFPFWYTGVLIVKTIKFLKVRNKDPLTEEDKKFLSLIPTLFLSMSLNIAVFFLLFYFNIFDKIIANIQVQINNFICRILCIICSIIYVTMNILKKYFLRQ